MGVVVNLGSASLCVLVGLGSRWVNHAQVDQTIFHYTGKLLTCIWDGTQWGLNKVGEYAASLVPAEGTIRQAGQLSNAAPSVWQSKSFVYGTATYGATAVLCLSAYAIYSLCTKKPKSAAE
jgi:hypothetical protein